MPAKSTRTAKEDIQLAVMANDLKYIKDDVATIKKNMVEGYVPLSRYILVERIVFGLVGLILVAVVGAIMTVALRAKP